MIGKVGSLVISELILRRLVGVLGMALPFALLLANGLHIEPSISDFYYADSGLPAPRNIFVGIMAAVGVFLCCYRGWDIRDRVLARVAGFSAILVALVPCAPVNDLLKPDVIRGWFHLGFAAIFLATLAFISLVQFTKTRSINTMTLQKQQRNGVYRFCGWVMLGCLAAIVVYDLFFKTEQNQYLGVVYFFEGVAVFFFGVSWLVKGEFILGDPPKTTWRTKQG
jgi:hypothetical protein